MQAVEELSARISAGDTCHTDEVLLEPGLPQLRSSQQLQQQKRARRHGSERRKPGDKEHHEGALHMLLPVFPAPDATVGRG